MVSLEADLLSVGNRWHYLKDKAQWKKKTRQIRDITSKRLPLPLDLRGQEELGVGTAMCDSRTVPNTDCDQRQWDITTASPHPYWGDTSHQYANSSAFYLLIALGLLLAEPIQKPEDRGSLLRKFIDVSLLGHRAGWRKAERECGVASGEYTKYHFFKNCLLVFLHFRSMVHLCQHLIGLFYSYFSGFIAGLSSLVI